MNVYSSTKPYRPVDHWKSAIMALPEGSFFELLRSVFGNIKTPFSKHKLMEDLSAFLSNKENRKSIAAFISGQDHKVIAATALLDEPETEELESFFAGEMTQAELNAVVINLEERLIIYRFRDEKKLRLALNPVLDEVLAPLIADTRPLFPSYLKESRYLKEGRAGTEAAVSENSAGTEAALSEDGAGTEATVSKDDLSPYISDSRVLAALFAFIIEEEELFKGETGTESRGTKLQETRSQGNPLPELRKKVLDGVKKTFPHLDFELVINNLIQLGLFSRADRLLVPNGEKIAEYSGLSDTERQEYWAAGLYICFKETEKNAHGGRSGGDYFSFSYPWSRLRSIAAYIHRFRTLLDPGRIYPELTLRRLWDFLGTRAEAGGTAAKSAPEWPSYLAVMEKTGLLKAAGVSGEEATFWFSPLEKPKERPSGEPVIVMDTAFSFILYPEISFADALALSAFCSLKGCDGTLISFELTSKSAVRGFDQGLKAKAMMELLQRLSENRLDPNLDWTIKDWEKRYTGVSLHQGIVLTLSEDNRYLAKAGPVSHLIDKTLAPGVYLLSTEERSVIVKALHKAGIDIVAQPPEDAGGAWPKRGGSFRNSFPHFYPSEALEHDLACMFSGSSKETPAKETPPAETDAETSNEGASIKERFRVVLDNMKITKQEREELMARIERGLVLNETQLESTSLRYEKLEARGLDYAGKTSIAKQAIETGSILEITWPGRDGEPNRTVGIPQALEKKEGDNLLVLRASGNPENAARVLKIPLGKISLLRRIKQSIFGE
jgi:hypothetical protein